MDFNIVEKLLGIMTLGTGWVLWLLIILSVVSVTIMLERLVFFPIVNKKHVEAVGDQAFGTTSPVGTGPWKFVEWKRDQLIRLEAFDQHWRGKPAFKHLIFRAIGFEGIYIDYSTHGFPFRRYRGRPPMEQEIAVAAYFIWKRENEVHGRDLAHWFMARELLEKGVI